MIYAFLVIIAITVASLTLGPISHIAITGSGAPNLVIITIWGFVWLTNIEIAYRWAIILGLIFDFVSFLPFGFWTALFTIITYITNQLKNRFFELSSVSQAIFVLIIQLVIWEVVTSAVAGQMSIGKSIFSLFYSTVLGLLVYYIFAVRYKLLQRWLGRRI